MVKSNLIYLLGAGRSGTTIIATVLGRHSQIITIGEMHQFLDHLVEHRECSCGQALAGCSFWKKIVNKLDMDSENLISWQQSSNSKELHRKVPSLLLSQKGDSKYLEIHETIFDIINNSTLNNEFILDSSKYIARYLLLRKSQKINVKGIYVVRDVRGVISSFKKKVQTSRSPISTVIYYSLINFFGQIICWTDKNVIKIRYEDFMERPNEVLMKIYEHLNIENENIIVNEYQVPHIIGGNRLKHQSKIVLNKDEKWKENIPRHKQILYYLQAFPFMLMNKYNI